MNETEILAKDSATMSKTIGIVRGLQGKTNIKIVFGISSVIFQPAAGREFTMTNTLFNKLDTNEIVNIIEGHINGSIERV
jgi:uncharacterized protein YhbP (UPF0306 family)